MRRLPLLIGAAALVVLAIVLVLLRREPAPTLARENEAFPRPVAAGRPAPEVGAGIVRGDAAAPVTIHEFADYQCPACAQFATRTVPGVVERYVETGRVRYVFHDFPLVQLHPYAYAAALAARCAGERGRYWEMHDLLFARQASWAREGPGEVVGALAGLAGEAGVEPEAVEACIRAERHRDAVLSGLEQAERLGLRATPSLFIGDRLLEGAVPLDSLSTLIEAELAAAGSG